MLVCGNIKVKTKTTNLSSFSYKCAKQVFLKPGSAPTCRQHEGDMTAVPVTWAGPCDGWTEGLKTLLTGASPGSQIGSPQKNRAIRG